MIVKKMILVVLVVLFSSSNLTFANENISSVANNFFVNFSTKIDNKYKDNDKKISIFKRINTRLNQMLSKKKIKKDKEKIIKDLIILSNEYIFEKRLEKEEKYNKNYINKDPLVKNFKYKSFNKDHIFLENGIWYAYIFKKTLYFDVENKELNEPTLAVNNIYKNKTMVFLKEDGRYGFVNDFEKRRLISDSIIYGVTGKYNFLVEVKDDNKKLNQNTDKAFKKLKEITLKLTSGKTEKKKIEAIYNYILSNVTYTEKIQLDQAKIFSGINTFVNKDGVCEGYVKLFLYMLDFANIDGGEVVRGYVIDAKDFPQIGHAWIKIGEKYYDPTFDDPVGQLKTKTFGEYNYYGLPYDLFYTNRYDYKSTPDYLKKASLEYRKVFVKKKIASLIKKYKNSGYHLLKPYLLRERYNISLSKTLDINDLKKIVPYYEVDNRKININGKLKLITSYKYYSVNNANVENILNTLDYNFDGYYLFHIKNDNGVYEYRLAYKVKFI